MNGRELLDSTLARAKAGNRAALGGYLPAGFPTVEGAVRGAVAMAEGGCDVIEIGLPHSDPVLDGPVIQTADDLALRGGLRTADVIRTIRDVSAATGAPVLCMTYWNPVHAYGPERFAAGLAAAGGAGCVLVDLPVEEAGEWLRGAAPHGLATVFLAAPSSTDRRLAEIAAASSGFVYTASLMGVTGTRERLGVEAAGLVSRVRATTDLPVCVGVGVSDAAQAAEVAGFADGVIVGTAFVQRLLDAPGLAAGVDAVRDLARDLVEGLDGTVTTA